MAYNGYGYPQYQHTNARAQQNQAQHAPPSSQTPKLAAPAPQNSSQDYGQRHGSWNGQNASGPQTSNQQNASNNYWIPSNSTTGQSIAYQQQVSYRVSDTNQATNSVHQYNGQIQPQSRTSTHGATNYGNESNSSMDTVRDTVNSTNHYISNSSPGQTATVPAVAMSQNPRSYQPNAPPHQSDYMQNSRTAAATAMTALSTAARRNYTQNVPATNTDSYQVSNSVRYNAPARGPTRSQLATNNSNSSNTVYQFQASNSGQAFETTGTAASSTLHQTSNTPGMSTPSVTSSAEPSPQLQHRVHQAQSTSHSPTLLQHPDRTSSGSQMRPPPQKYSMNNAVSDNERPSAAMNQSAYSQPTDASSVIAESATHNSLPRFVDPTNVYNPYYRQFGASGAAHTAHTAHTTVESDAASVASGIETTQVVAQQNSTQSPALNVTELNAAPTTTLSNTASNALNGSITNKGPKDTPKPLSKPLSKGTPKKVRKKPSRKTKSAAAGTSIITAVEPQTASSTQEQANDKEDTATQMQIMLDEMRKKDPDLFRSILAANMSKQESNGQKAQVPANVVDGITANDCFADSSTPGSAQPPQLPHSNHTIPLKETRKKRAAGEAVFRISTHAQKGAAPSTVNNMSTGNIQAEQRLLEAALPSTTPGEMESGVEAASPGQITKLGFIDGLPDLGKFPALRRKRKPKISLLGNGSHSDSISISGLNNEVNTADHGGGTAPTAQAATTMAQPYAALSIEEQRLSLLDNFTRTGNAEFPQSHANPPPTTKDTQLSQADHVNTTHQTPPPPQVQRQSSGEEVGKGGNMTSIWPYHKRRVLTESACEYIATLPGNGPITPEFVSSLIEQNPSYVQLCNMLEDHGYTVNKVHFAKHLLQAFPDLGESSNNATKPISEPTLQAPHPSLPVSSFVSSTPATPIPQQSPKATKHHIGTVPVNSGTNLPLSKEEQRQKSLNLLHISKRRMKNAPQRRTSISASPAPQPREPFPNSKEAMARKQTFAEIVDLSQAFSDEDESGPEDEEIDQPNQVIVGADDPMDTSPDVPMEDNIPSIPVQPNTTETLAQNPLTDREVVPAAQPQPTRSREPSLATQPTAEEPVNTAKHKEHNGIPQTTGIEDLRRFNGIIKPINKAKALKRSYYDPRTIARDILIAAGRHPTERPLNHHLLKLKEKFQFIDYTSDLETFRWDLVDPGGPPPPKITPEPLIPQPKFHPRDTSRDATSGRQYQSLDRAPSQLRISHTINADSASPLRAMAPTPTRSSHASPLPTRRRPGRPPGAKNKPKPVPSIARHVEVAIPRATPQPSSNTYAIYECHFDSCGAKLHNFEVFRKHVLKLHSQAGEDQAVCLWTGCVPTQSTPRTFSTGGLKEHLDNVHLSPLAWKLGDGPKSVSSGHPCFNPSSCLYDDEGRAVVSKATTNGSTPAIILPTTWRPIRDFNKNHGHDSYRSSALQIMRALSAKQANVGAGLGPGGCILMNEQRQGTVVAHDDVYRILPAGKREY
ncbi:hypothetical protein MGYG_00124 [Nannizzia gypsea CBS 118893]|uniref:C2H2-type domain-containing protein n=1 Tax=Arthroderma gypseum (strain ATCC MYA-4604 / CBS 118893) TaxID=535722 RepID=E5R352_ARTGP|nr:hypothetical protein MGYG_00124 [Nannizzia gypsea CBS 118893]EFQ97081.1 hypothetical protein MGYG_00124 [Nannizzia gypsea CBS 118893]